MKLREKAIMLSLLLIPMVSVAGSNPTSYSDRFKAWMSGSARRAAAQQSTYLLPVSESNGVRPVVQRAPEEVAQAYKAAEEIDDLIIEAEADLNKAWADFNASRSGTREHRRLAKVVKREQEQLESLGREGKMRHDIFKAEAEKARNAGLLSGRPGERFVEQRPGKEESYGFALARGIHYANIAQLKEKEGDAIVRMYNAAADAGRADTPEAYAAAERAKEDYQVIQLALLKEEESLAANNAGNAKMRLWAAQVEGQDTTQMKSEARRESQEHERLSQLAAAVAAQVEQNERSAVERANAQAPSLSSWWRSKQADRVLQGTGWDTAGQTLRDRLHQQEARDAAERLQRERWNPAGY